jgi:hypothetical protein
VLAANLSRVAESEIVSRYEKILAMEEGTLADSSGTLTTAEDKTAASSGK